MAKFHLAASFSVAEAAEIANVPEDTFRTWHARNPTKYLGVKQGHRVWFSALDIFFYSIVRDLTAYGVGVRVAMYNAARFADEIGESDGPIRDEILLVRTDAGKTTLQLCTHSAAFSITQSSLYVPLRPIWDDIIKQAREAFAKAAT